MVQYKVMIIEDDLNAAQSISRFLETWGFQCKYLDNFQEVIEKFVEYKPEIILLDITLPRYNGYYLSLIHISEPTRH